VWTRQLFRSALILFFSCDRLVSLACCDSKFILTLWICKHLVGVLEEGYSQRQAFTYTEHNTETYWHSTLKSRSSGLWYCIVMWYDTAVSEGPEDGGSRTLRNIGILSHHYTVSQSGRPRLESSSPWTPKVSSGYVCIHSSVKWGTLIMVKVKVFPGLFLTEHHAIKTYWGSIVIAPRILWTRH
jgi:hypothetical protein